MSRSALLLAAIVGATLGFALIRTAFAQGTTVHRCIGEHGEISFSDAPCGGAAAPVPRHATASAPITFAGDRTSATPTCPVSGDALRNVVAAAFAERNPNTLAGVMRWDGIGGAAARSRMLELAALTRRPLIGIDLQDGVSPTEMQIFRDDDETGAAADSMAPRAIASRRADAMLTIRTGSLEGGAGEHEFRLAPSNGCYWLGW